MYMYRAIYLLQPNFAWHDHTNNSNEPIIWIDALDSGLVKLFVEVPENVREQLRRRFSQIFKPWP